jgi:hypothetical protein
MSTKLTKRQEALLAKVFNRLRDARIAVNEADKAMDAFLLTMPSEEVR